YEEHEISDDFEEWRSLVHPDDLEPTLERVRHSIAQARKDHQAEFRFRHKDGSYRWILTQGSVFQDETGRPIRMIGSHVDITERKRAEEALRESEERFSTIFKVSPIPASLTRMSDLKLTEVNDAWCRSMGFSREESIGHTGEELGIIDHETRANLGEEFLREGSLNSAEATITTKRGEKREILTSIELLSIGGEEFALNLIVDVTERKRAEEALSTSEMLNRSLIEHLPQRVFVKDRNSVYVSCNANFAQDFGIAPEEIAGKDDFAFNPPELAEGYRADDQAVMAVGTLKDIEERYQLAGEERWAHTIKVPYRDKDGQIIGVLGIFEDITERKKAAAEAIRAAREWQTTFDATNDVIWVLDKDHRVLRSNKAAEWLFQRPCGEIIGRRCWEIVHETAQPIPECPVVRARESLRRETMELQVGESWFEVTVDPILDAAGRYDGAVHIVSDITERKRAEETLEKSEKMYRDAIETARAAVYYQDYQKDEFSFVSPIVEQLTGYRPEEFNRETFLASICETILLGDLAGLSVKEAVEKARSGKGVSWRADNRIKTRSGEELWLANYAVQVRDDKGKVIGSLGILQDITERKRLEDQFRQAQKMEAVGRLAGGVAHDFNNMLQTILGYAQMALDQVDSDSTLREDLLEILEAAQRSADLTRQLLAFARRQTVSPKVLDLNGAVSGTLKMLGRLIGEDIDLAWMPGHEIWKVLVDPSQIDQLLANLVVNARDAIAGVGKVTIETANVVFDDAYCTEHIGSVSGEYVLLGVSDNGCGMDKETLAHVFEPFFTTKGVGKGTGLGMATVYGIVKQNDGFINVYSEPGEGTTFKIYLPRSEVEAAETREERVAGTPRRGTETVMIVEDEAALLKIGRRMLEELGYTVLTANTPGEAIRLVEEHSGDIDLLITDVVMPEMNGRELAERLTRLKPGTKCLFMSGYTANVIAHHGVLEEGVRFIQKPFSVEVLAEKVREVLGE
ncbi:MAG: PAS domain S-box protein, partial [bacterium]